MLKNFILFINVVVLLFLPFQRLLLDYFAFPDFFSFIDEIFSIFYFIILFFLLSYKFRIKKSIFYFCLLIVIFVLLGIISGIYNGNSFKITSLGIFDYIKNFIFIPTLGMVNFTRHDVKRIYKILIYFAVFLCIVSIVIIFGWLLDINFPLYLGEIREVRFGLPRVAPFQIHPNLFGLYSLLFFILDFGISKKLNFKKVMLLSGVLFSVSRIVYSAFTIGFLFILFKSRIRYKVIYVFMFALLFVIIMLPKITSKTIVEYSLDGYYRGYVFKKSFEIWKTSPILGVGPGMYGGVVSVKFNSPIYEKFNFSRGWYNYGLKNFHSLDTFWPQILVEIGLVGTFLFLFLFFQLYKIAKYKLNTSDDYFIKRFSLGLSVMPFVIFSYLFGSGLNLTLFLVTYSVFLGTTLGVSNINEGSVNK